MDSASSSLDSALLMRRFLVGRSSSSAGGGRLFSVFLPTSEGALKGFMMPMPVFDLHRMQLFQAVVCSSGGSVHIYVRLIDVGRRVLTRSNLKWPQTFEDMSQKFRSTNPNTNPGRYSLTSCGIGCITLHIRTLYLQFVLFVLP
jgi:hypothetical protein